MSQEKIRFKIVNKANDGITLSARKGSKPQKISWNEFNQYYTIEDKVWAVPNEEIVKRMEEVEEHINNATVSFILSGGLKAGNVPSSPENFSHILATGEDIRKISELTGCSLLDATQLVRDRVDLIRNGDIFGRSRKPKYKRHFENKETSNDVLDRRHHGDTSADVEMHNNAILEDNSALLALKEKMSKEEK